MRTSKTNLLVEGLESDGFAQLVEEPTHIKGGIIDHVYFKEVELEFDVNVALYSPYYTAFDHDALLVTLVEASENAEKVEQEQVCQNFVRLVARKNNEMETLRSGS